MLTCITVSGRSAMGGVLAANECGWCLHTHTLCQPNACTHTSLILRSPQYCQCQERIGEEGLGILTAAQQTRCLHISHTYTCTTHFACCVNPMLVHTLASIILHSPQYCQRQERTGEQHNTQCPHPPHIHRV